MTMEIEGRDVTLEDAERQPCEVWTRVMGYYRPVSEFNIGKKGEHAERRYYGPVSRELPAPVEQCTMCTTGPVSRPGNIEHKGAHT